jgi:carotenoid cleavage dioxygenase-like enzyme
MPLPSHLLAPLEPENKDLVVTAGRWPDDIAGEYLVSAPHPRYFPASPHAFFGDGIHYRLSLRPGTHEAGADQFAWRWHWVDSPSTRLRLKRPDLFEGTLIGTQSPFGFSNAANTAPLPWKDRLLLTWDVGRPVEVDPHSMRFLGEMGHRDEWKETLEHPVLPMIASTAHPVTDHDRDCVWTVNLFLGDLYVVRWRGGRSIDRWPITGARLPQSVHTITVTRNWIIVADCAFKVEPQMLSGGERREPNNASEPIYLIRKDTLEATRPGEPVGCTSFELAPEVMHYYALWDDSDGVTILFEHTHNVELGIAMRADDKDATGAPCDPALNGIYGFGMAPSRITVKSFDPESGLCRDRAEMTTTDRRWSTQLTAMDWSSEGLERPTMRHTVFHGWRPQTVTQRVLDLYGDRVDQRLFPAEETPARIVSLSMPDLQTSSEYVWPLDELPTSPSFVPRTGACEPGGHNGYVVLGVYGREGFRVELFDAADVGRGPLATLAAPQHTVPFVIHSAWMPTVDTPASAERVRFSDELDRLDGLVADAANAARVVARELDEEVPVRNCGPNG